MSQGVWTSDGADIIIPRLRGIASGTRGRRPVLAAKPVRGASCCRLNSKAPAPIAAATSHGVHPVAAGVVSSSLAPESKLSRKRAKPAFNSAGSKGMASDTRPATWGNESPRFTAAREGAGGGLFKLRCVPDALAAASPANKNGRFGCVNAGAPAGNKNDASVSLMARIGSFRRFAKRVFDAARISPMSPNGNETFWPKFWMLLFKISPNTLTGSGALNTPVDRLPAKLPPFCPLLNPAPGEALEPLFSLTTGDVVSPPWPARDQLSRGRYCSAGKNR